MKLYIDQGNSRLKLWLASEVGQVTAHAVCVDVEAAVVWLDAQLARCHLEAVHVSSVCDAERQAELAAAFRGVCGALSFAHVDVARLPTTYLQPEKLGVDRWLAVLAVCRRPAAVVVDAGTAFTVDLLVAGRHMGGYILPGLSLQREALAGRTARVSFAEPDWHAVTPGNSTAACVGHGGVLSLSALVREAAHVLCAQSGLTPELVLTGGDARYFESLRADMRPWLVLEGLAIYFGDKLVLPQGYA